MAAPAGNDVSTANSSLRPAQIKAGMQAALQQADEHQEAHANLEKRLAPLKQELGR